MNEPKYTPTTNHEQLNCVNGPGNGLGYYAHTLYPDLTCRDKEEAKRAAIIANIAYDEGYAQAQYDIKKALGL